jgi:hypothetical protein
MRNKYDRKREGDNYMKRTKKHNTVDGAMF